MSSQKSRKCDPDLFKRKNGLGALSESTRQLRELLQVPMSHCRTPSYSCSDPTCPPSPRDSLTQPGGIHLRIEVQHLHQSMVPVRIPDSNTRVSRAHDSEGRADLVVTLEGHVTLSVCVFLLASCCCKLYNLIYNYSCLWGIE